jgi:hypothetical protein
MNKLILALTLTFFSLACATHECILSRRLRPVVSPGNVGFQMELFRARVQMDRLEVWARARRNGGDYETGFELEIASTAALCAALARSDLTFEQDWSMMVLELTNEYGSQWGWRNILGYTKARIPRETLTELGQRNVPPSEYPRFWSLFAYKVGPPDFVPYEWSTQYLRTGYPRPRLADGFDPMRQRRHVAGEALERHVPDVRSCLFRNLPTDLSDSCCGRAAVADFGIPTSSTHP